MYAAADNLDEVKALAKENKCAAILFETIQGEGGVIPLSQEFVSGLVKIAGENDLLLIADEVQTGNGRTGQLYGYMNYGIVPDIVTTAKGLGGGLPIGATMLGEKVKDVYTPGLHGSTFGGNPLCCAGAVDILSRIDDQLLAGVHRKSSYIMDALDGAKGIKSVSGMGLMLGIETEKEAGQVVSACIEKGVLPLKAKNKVRLLPPLNIPMEELEKAITIIKEVCAE